MRVRRGPGTLYRRLQSLRFLLRRDRRAVLRFLATPYPALPLRGRLALVGRFVHTTNQVRAYHAQAEMLAVADAILRRSGPTVVECGVAKGASTAKLSLATRIAGGHLHVFDSFQGIPANDERHHNTWGKPVVFRAGAFRGRLPSVRRTVARFGAPEVCTFHKGWFADTLPGFHPALDVVLLDVDLLASTRTCLVHLFPLLRPDGVLFSQDGHLEATAALLRDDAFWRDAVGVPPPRMRGLGSDRLVELRPATA
ncbi:MAG: class I SAM-dependent methyltransferase [bacterium]|nr:class I SAM-dependent methyltransferase [bacterium]